MIRALIIIDMQKGSFKPYSLRYDTLNIISRINSLASSFRAAGAKVIFVQHDGTKENAFLPGSGDWELLPELQCLPGDVKVSKTANDCFYGSRLDTVLKENNIASLFFAGCATDFCVDTTVKAALARDYETTVIEDAHTTADRSLGKAETIISYYNWLWREMLPAKHKIKVISAEECRKSIEE